MQNELDVLLDTAIYKEIASQALYIAAQDKTQDPSAKTLLKELAEEELGHSELLKNLKDKIMDKVSDKWSDRQNRIQNLMISEYLTGPENVEGAGLQETLVFAMKREQQAIEFYSKMMNAMIDEAAKRLCERLVREELKHKLRPEMFYDDFFYRED